MSDIDATITRVRQRPNGVVVYFDAYPGKLGIIGPCARAEVGQRVEASANGALVGPGRAGVGGEIASYRREGLRLYSRNGVNNETHD